MNSRRDKIEQMLRDEPEDLFLRYALAMELEKEEQPQLALDLHRSLIDGTPPYVASYFRSAQILAGMDQVERARGLLRDGIEVARSQNDLHAAAEMSEMLAGLGSLGE